MRKLLTTKLIVSFIVFSVITLAFAWICPMTMSSSAMGTMLNATTNTVSSCVIHSQSSNCAPAFAKQIAHIQQAAIASVQFEQVLFLILIYGAILLATYLAYINKLLLLLYHRYISHLPDIKLFNYLLIAFSKGLIHPKLYY